MASPYRTQTRQEENLNAAIHGIGLLLAIAATPFLLIKANSNNPVMIWAVSTFAFGMIAVYLSSTLYHLAIDPELKRKANIVDHISIYFLIGGTYTPIILFYLDQNLSTLFLCVQWAIIAVASILKIFFTGKYHNLSVSLYIMLGWMLVFVIKPLIEAMPPDIFLYIIAGGMFYTTGILFYNRDKQKYAHNIWHCFVLAGTLLHFIAIYKSL